MWILAGALHQARTHCNHPPVFCLSSFLPNMLPKSLSKYCSSCPWLSAWEVDYLLQVKLAVQPGTWRKPRFGFNSLLILFFLSQAVGQAHCARQMWGTLTSALTALSLEWGEEVTSQDLPWSLFISLQLHWILSSSLVQIGEKSLPGPRGPECICFRSFPQEKSIFFPRSLNHISPQLPPTWLETHDHLCSRGWNMAKMTDWDLTSLKVKKWCIFLTTYKARNFLLKLFSCQGILALLNQLSSYFHHHDSY